MSETDQFFNEEIKAIATDSKAIASDLAEELQFDVQRQIRRSFGNANAAFSAGVKTYDFDNGSYVRLSPLLSSFAEDAEIKGNPHLWILLPDGARLGFKRIGRNFNWDTLKRRFGSSLSFVDVADGAVVLYRSPQGVKPIYKIQSVVKRKRKIDFWGSVDRIARENNLEVFSDD